MELCNRVELVFLYINKPIIEWEDINPISIVLNYSDKYCINSIIIQDLVKDYKTSSLC